MIWQQNKYFKKDLKVGIHQYVCQPTQYQYRLFYKKITKTNINSEDLKKGIKSCGSRNRLKASFCRSFNGYLLSECIFATIENLIFISIKKF